MLGLPHVVFGIGIVGSLPGGSTSLRSLFGFALDLDLFVVQCCVARQRC